MFWIKKILRFIIRIIFKSQYKNIEKVPLIKVKNGISFHETNDKIKQLIESDFPCMVTRFGSVELDIVIKYKNIITKSIIEKIINFGYTGECDWWTKKNTFQFGINAGFFPTNSKNINQFALLMIECMYHINLLASWVNGENIFDNELKKASICHLQDIEPYFHEQPWTKSLENKKVLVIHPFTESISRQYNSNRGKIFSNPNVLPKFELFTVKAVQSIAGNKTAFNNWFEALDYMFIEAIKIDFDVAIIGCGAYGLPLAAKIKQYGKKAIHLGGATQILFGIKGNRWDKIPEISQLYNDYWIRPLNSEKPQYVDKVEGACYW